MPTYQIQEILIHIGLALVAGVLIATVPIARRLARYESRIVKRVIFNLISLAALVGFCFYAWYLWDRYIPRAPEALAHPPLMRDYPGWAAELLESLFAVGPGPKRRAYDEAWRFARRRLLRFGAFADWRKIRRI